MAGGSSTTSAEQVLLPGQGVHRVLAAGAQGGDRGCPRKTPRLRIPLEFNTGGFVRERRSRLPRESNKILDSSDHSLNPNSSSSIHPSPSLARCKSSTRLPWPRTRAGRGRGQGRAEGVAFAAVTRGASPRGRASAVTTPPRPAPGPAPRRHGSGQRLGTTPGARGWYSQRRGAHTEGEAFPVS